MPVKPSKSAVDAFVREMHACILRDGKGMTQTELIRKLNPKIRGLANYHRHTCASKVFDRLDHIIYLQLRRWARRRHPNKSKGWVYSRY